MSNKAMRTLSRRTYRERWVNPTTPNIRKKTTTPTTCSAIPMSMKSPTKGIYLQGSTNRTSSTYLTHSTHPCFLKSRM